VKINKILFLVVYLICAIQITHGQDVVSTTLDSSGIEEKENHFFAAYPFVFYLPETRWGFGGAAVYTFRPKNDTRSRTSNIQLGAAYTLNKQILTYLSYNILLDKDRWLFKGELGYYDYFYPYFGLGPKTIQKETENYFVEFPRLRAIFMRKIFNHIYTGGQIIWDNYNISKIEENGLLEAIKPKGYLGSDILGLGLAVQIDKRDNQFYPRSGIFSDLRLNFYNANFGSSLTYNKITVNLNRYDIIWKEKDHILVSQIALFYSGGDVPFQELSLWGGPQFGRGYTPGRFRDRAMGILQSEYRFPIYWRFKGAIFGSLGGVNTSLNKVMEYPIWNAGAGIKFLLSKEDQLHMRLDYGISKEGGEFYLTVGEAF